MDSIAMKCNSLSNILFRHSHIKYIHWKLGLVFCFPKTVFSFIHFSVWCLCHKAGVRVCNVPFKLIRLKTAREMMKKRNRNENENDEVFSPNMSKVMHTDKVWRKLIPCYLFILNTSKVLHLFYLYF